MLSTSLDLYQNDFHTKLKMNFKTSFFVCLFFCFFKQSPLQPIKTGKKAAKHEARLYLIGNQT